MNTALKYKYDSVFAPYIESLVLQKKSCGFAYDCEAYILKKFDELCVKRGCAQPRLTREIAMECWTAYPWTR